MHAYANPIISSQVPHGNLTQWGVISQNRVRSDHWEQDGITLKPKELVTTFYQNFHIISAILGGSLIVYWEKLVVHM